MLVLVLILVVIALVLLLAGWFLHLVVLAWTSVGISVLAGLVLVYDWWQTRSAVRAGRQGSGSQRDGDGDRAAPRGAAAAGAVGAGAVGAGAAGAAGAGPDPYGGADMEPATQVLPVVPPPANAAEETVVMPVVAPSGSAEAPSGASRSSGLSSQSVAESSADEPVTTRAADGTTAGDPAAGPEPGGGGDPATHVRETGSDAAGAARTSDAGEQATTAAPADGAG
ncbi:MAG: hypothetical protein M3235_18125, partial [Actinomycetota bacterium]|nr:hypothetical protein [Actinomycetota bacterium]